MTPTNRSLSLRGLLRRLAATPSKGSRSIEQHRSGMTMIEVVVAITLLSGALMVMGAFIARYANISGMIARRSEANELVADRLEEVKGAIRYSVIDSLYAKNEATIANHPGYSRKTLVVRTGGAAPSFYDYKTVTVIVSGGGLATPSKKTTVISVF
jgi:prepilin-type N-terminal cleavage/methylation domain-containing protein